MPQVANYAVMGAPKPGAVVLMDVAEAGHRPTPLLAIQNYGHGRVGVFATAGSWRWKMLQDHTDTHARDVLAQLLRWLVTETPGQVRRRLRIRCWRTIRRCRLRVSRAG